MCIDEFFKDRVVDEKIRGIQAAHGTPKLKFPSVSFNSAYKLYKKIDPMTANPGWSNGYVDFKLAKNRCYSSDKKTFLVQLGTPIPTELANAEA